jgi:hypothetical protein
VSDFIPHRVPAPDKLHAARGRRAAEEYRERIKLIVDSLLKEYRQIIYAEKESLDPAGTPAEVCDSVF